jgi:hypothetical protein
MLKLAAKCCKKQNRNAELEQAWREDAAEEREVAQAKHDNAIAIVQVKLAGGV